MATADSTELKDSLVLCQTSQGVELRAGLVRTTRHLAVFEVYSPFAVLQVSEVLADFRIFLNDRLAYSGRAVVKSLIYAGAILLCEATLEDSWLDTQNAPTQNGVSAIRAEYGEFMRASQQVFKVLPEFKLMIADMQWYLQDLRHWLEQIELQVQSQPGGSRQDFERKLLEDLQPAVFETLRLVFERFEHECKAVPAELQPAHGMYVKRQLHPLVLCAPFMYRTFQKPLGYAGDYEMVNMMVRNPLEGASVFARVLNAYFLTTPPVVAHRNRLVELKAMLIREALRVAQSGRAPKVFSLGCGPAKEVQDFLADSDLSDRAQFTLLDFSEETLNFAQRVLAERAQSHNRSAKVHLVKKSVAQFLREAGRPNSSLVTVDYDVVYCAGLFDYLTDQVCSQLTTVLYRMLAPGGLLVVTNVDAYNPSRHWMEFSVDWHLIYRNHEKMLRIAPAGAPREACRIRSENSGVNIFLEVQKPGHA